MANDLTVVSELCELDKTSLRFKRDVSLEEWKIVFGSLKKIEGCVQFWIGDALAYRQQKWGMYDDIAEETGMDKKQLWDYKKVSESVKPSERSELLGYCHHREVAALPPEKQERFLNKAVEEKLSVRDLRQEIKKENRADKKQPIMPDGKYQVIYADPPWQYNDKQETSMLGGAEKHYSTMPVDEICDLEIYDIAHDNAVLFIWVTSPLLEVVFDVINAWGFEYKTSFVWDKVKHNMGHYNSVRHEFLLIATRGSCTPDNTKLYDSVQSVERAGHSQKPDKFYEIIEALYHGKKIELFARQKREGWDSWGNEI